MIWFSKKLPDTPRCTNAPTRGRRPGARGRAARLLVLLVLLALGCGFALHAGAQVAQHSLYQGRLTDATGAPKTGTVAITLRVFSVATAGVHLYQEDHLAVTLGPGGTFAVALGSGTNPDGNYETALQTAAPLYLEVVADGDLLSPRQPIASAPVAVTAASLTPAATRFEDCGDGTVADHQTGLNWEKKTGEVGAGVNCSVVACPNLHDVNNGWTWSDSGTLPDGGIFEEFLLNLNDATFGVAQTASEVTGCFAGHCDWRLPTIGELRTILIGSDASPGQNSSCVSAPCVDPDFTAQAGPTFPGRYWSASSFTGPPPDFAWLAQFNNGFVNTNVKSSSLWVRAVRAGSCDES